MMNYSKSLTKMMKKNSKRMNCLKKSCSNCYYSKMRMNCLTTKKMKMRSLS